MEKNKCPLCGSKEIKVQTRNLIGDSWSKMSIIKCSSCGYSTSATTEIEAIELFNKDREK